MDSCIPVHSAQEAFAKATPSHRLLAVGEQKRSGLILCKSHYAEFAGPGAAIGSPVEQEYSSVIAIGSPEIAEVVTYEERQKAYGRRIQWVRWLQKIVTHPDPTQRAEKLFSGFEEFFGSEILAGIPTEVLALLAGVFPQTITAVRSQNRSFGTTRGLSWNPSPEELQVNVITLDWKTFQPTVLRTAAVVRTNIEAITVLPYSA